MWSIERDDTHSTNAEDKGQCNLLALWEVEALQDGQWRDGYTAVAQDVQCGVAEPVLQPLANPTLLAR